ncbi:protein of unknown function DUF378 [Syntrophobotulus glycolicus DSM 8271]|uniref:DUF378 domain-containing protein n=1 Tax=Syntrophobotulus glycolicus (strain DSM 8271 / FlGlyR) TaxID=645991 RepID=F0SYM2_SYNGF|nr:DUF378 domain-containing protein [Syntrophobotulus glycolicus]ADY54823.1 protein of unknown function DUF378 [Syntrophobotulus glycolicus DSM 8271]
MNIWQRIALVLVIIGALNWGMIGIFGIDFISAIFGGMYSVASRIIFTLVGICGLYLISLFFLTEREGDTESRMHPVS